METEPKKKRAHWQDPPCIYRKHGVVCNEKDVNKKCDTCGWNPAVEQERIKKIMNKGETEK